MIPTAEQFEKYENLKKYLKNLGRVVVAFSAGVDSTFLLYVARQVLDENVVAVTAAAPFVPARELEDAKAYCAELRVQHKVVELDERRIENFVSNPKNRCYYCKKAIFGTFLAYARSAGVDFVLEGSNMDDLGDYRPGMQAIKELGIVSPLRAAQLTKNDIRQLSRYMQVPTWNKPSFACLASRFVYGEEITREKLARVEKAEQLLLDMGFEQFRVRMHGDLARIEVLPEDLMRVLEQREVIYEELKKDGFSYITMDLRGYRTGSMNEMIKVI